MIFLTVGTQLPFDRLVRAVMELSESFDDEIIFQVGDTGLDILHMENVHKYLQPHMYAKYFNECDLLISHAGMGGIIDCVEAGKPLIVMPRKEKYGEHRNDHQLSTVNSLGYMLSGCVAIDESELRYLLENHPFSVPKDDGGTRLQSLVSNLNKVLFDD